MSTMIRSPRAERVRSGSSNGSNKRKSPGSDRADDENNLEPDENAPESNNSFPPTEDQGSTKKSKLKDAISMPSFKALIKSPIKVTKSGPSTGAAPLNSNEHGMRLRNKSSLPRFTASGVKKGSGSTPSSIRRPTSSRIGTERSSYASKFPLPAEAVISNTPGKSSYRSALLESSNSSNAVANIPPTPYTSTKGNAVQKRLKKQIGEGEVIRGFFDGNFSVNEERVASILANCKVKSKWDYKEKSRKQETVIKELRDGLLKTIGDGKRVREQCLIHESHSNNLLRDALDEILDSSHLAAQFQGEAEELQGKVAALQDELFQATSSVMRFKTDQSPLRNRAKESEQRLFDVQSRLVSEEARRQQLEVDVERLSKELAAVQEQTNASLTTQKNELEARMEQSIASYKEEVALLRSELSRRQSDVDRFSGEKADLDKQKHELQDEFISMKSRLLDAESAAERNGREAERLTNEISALREQLSLKESDLRNTIASMNDIQKQGSEEKSGMRTELSVLQTRVQSLEEERLLVTTQLATKKEEFISCSRDLENLRKMLDSAEAKLLSKEQQLSQSKDMLTQLEVEKELRARSEIREEAERTERIAAVSQLLATQTECDARIREIEEKQSFEIASLNSSLQILGEEKENFSNECMKANDRAAGLEKEVQQLHSELEHASANHEAVEKLSKVTGELEIMHRRVKELTAQQELHGCSEAKRIAEFEEKLRVGESQRRKLHNLVQELRGNVRVFARVRPFLPNDGVDIANAPQSAITVRTDMNSLKITRPKTSAEDREAEHAFVFDKVFGPSSSQEVLFQEVSEFVQSALDGYNVCLFSYGQTGSGKTHTMQGSGNGSMKGIIPRAMEQVGLYKLELEKKGWEYTMEVSFVEIYNETIRDLLRVTGSEELKHEIKKDANGCIFISDVTKAEIDPNSTEEVEMLMEQAARHRSVGQTNMNERSSRSHSVFTLHLHALHAEQGVKLKGTLSLVDLAGSERLDRSGAEGQRKTEAVAINKSLSALTDVFVAIGNKQSHIPFRNSKLTYLLQPALSGDGKTLMMVNLSPTLESYGESLCSLRLAKQVNQCELGKPKKQINESGAGGATSAGASSSATPRKPNGQLSSSLSTTSSVDSTSNSTAMSASLGSRKLPAGSSGVAGARKNPRK